MAQNLIPADRVVAQEDGGDGFLLHLDTGQYYSLNRTGMVVWQALVDGKDPLATLQDRFPAAPAEQLRADVDKVLAQLTEANLVTSPPPA